MHSGVNESTWSMNQCITYQTTKAADLRHERKVKIEKETALGLQEKYQLRIHMQLERNMLLLLRNMEIKPI